MSERSTHNTLISLREYVDTRFEAQKEAVYAALAAADRAVNKAELASEKRFESVNEFRSALGDSARLLMPRAEFEQVISGLNKSIGELKERLDAREDKGAGISQGVMLIVTAIASISTIIMVIYWLTRAHA